MINVRKDKNGRMRIEISGRGDELIDEFVRVTEQVFKILGEEDCNIAFKAGVIAAEHGEKAMDEYLNSVIADKEKELEEASGEDAADMLLKLLDTLTDAAIKGKMN